MTDPLARRNVKKVNLTLLYIKPVLVDDQEVEDNPPEDYRVRAREGERMEVQGTLCEHKTYGH